MTQVIRCENIHKTYYMGRTSLSVLRGIDLSIQRGKFVAIMGSSGGGKSTLLHILSGLDVPQRGQVFYEDQPLFEPEGQRQIPVGRDADTNAAHDPSLPKSAKMSIIPGSLAPRRDHLLNTAFGFVFQFYHLLPEFDLLENTLLPRMVGQSMARWLSGRRETEERALELLTRVGLKDRLRHRPSELSGGERQRVAIARALMNTPEVLFADEPTGNLDSRTGKAIFELLLSLNAAGQTMVMVTHDRELAKDAHQVVQLVDGRIQ